MTSSPTHHIEELEPAQAHQRQRHGARLIDVRPAPERAAGMAAGAHGIAAEALLDQLRASQTPDDVELLLICGSGKRSLRAAEALSAQGFSRVYSVQGGTMRWRAAGLPMEHGELGAEAAERYARQMRLPQVGAEGQRRLRRSRVALIGAGGLGSPVALYLAAAGVGHLTLIDDDVVERSNLHRQVLHADDRLGEPKVESARQTLAALNPQVSLAAHATRLDQGNVDALLQGHDLVIDGADNFTTRYLLSAASLRLGLPLIYAAIDRFSGQVSVFDPRDAASPCYRCLYPEPPDAGSAPNCAEAGVLGVLPGLIGSLQATEALKLLLGIGQPLTGRLLMVDALGMQFRTLALARDPACPGCADPAHRRDTVTAASCSATP
ncbi:molybdopterin-synthase adenylyltransferase MoeB [Oleiagrimonas sp. C23AA]|uniref:molybdopterin-synthase adenylyltransferase MoeB n=1 Tax=Oleiagrimonas sp. C23AA TaxID=2719047 RepID=UPI001420D9D4|nr:molybdopterin-synthase adenylyltransferase MoeB [Oleiagrimonas sp. C23AA]NII10944.1 molybdopterin-synthase adenylyltransferase MoeB [Oleiagrimonas sp. C23AA]